MNTPAEVANAILSGFTRMDFPREMVASIVQAAIESDRGNREPEQKARHIVFTGPFEEFESLADAQNRMEDLLVAGHDKPTVVNAQTLPDGKVLGLTARKVIDTAKPGEIR